MAFQEIEAPDGTILEFPSDMSDEDILSVMRKNYPTTTPEPSPIQQRKAPIFTTPPPIPSQVEPEPTLGPEPPTRRDQTEDLFQPRRSSISEQTILPLQEEDTSFKSATLQGLAQPILSIGRTAELFGAEDVGQFMQSIPSPEGYESASQRFIDPKEEDFTIFGIAPAYAPRAVVEQGGQLLGSIATRAAGATAGGALGSVAGPAGAGVGALIGGFAGPALFQAAQIIGETAYERARNQGREEPNQDDINWALGTAAVSGAIESIGVGQLTKYLPGGDAAMRGLLQRLGGAFVKEGATEGFQSVVQQAGSSLDTAAGLKIDPKQAIGESLIGGGTGAAITGVTAPFTGRQEPDVIEEAEQPTVTPTPISEPEQAPLIEDQEFLLEGEEEAAPELTRTDLQEALESEQTAEEFAEVLNQQRQRVQQAQEALQQPDLLPTEPIDVGEPISKLHAEMQAKSDEELVTTMNESKNRRSRDAAKEAFEQRYPGEANRAATNQKIEVAELETNTDPSEAQKKAGNYKKGKVSVQGLPITIENPKGSERSGVDKDGEAWSVTMPATYGYVRGTEAIDGDQVDVYIGDNPEASQVFVVEQIDPDTKKYDEPKVMIGFEDVFQAQETYTEAFNDGRGSERIGTLLPMSMDKFKEWLNSGNTKKPIRYKEPEVEDVITEPTPEGEQLVIEGAERITNKELAERQMEAPARAEAPQKAPDEGLFDTGARAQIDLVEEAKKPIDDIKVEQIDPEKAFDYNHEEAINSLSMQQILSIAKKLGIRKGKNQSKAGFVEKIASNPKSEVRKAYFAVVPKKPIVYEGKSIEQQRKERAALREAERKKVEKSIPIGVIRGAKYVGWRAAQEKAGRYVDGGFANKKQKKDLDKYVDFIKTATKEQRAFLNKLEKEQKVEEDKRPEQVVQRPKKKLYGYNSIDLADNYSMEELNQLRKFVQEQHKLPTDKEGRPLGDEIYLYDKNGRKKLDNIAMAVTHKLQRKKTEEQKEKPIEVKPKRKVTRKRPLTFIEWVASTGGIKDFGEELKGMDAHKHFVPGFGRLVRKNGRDIDDIGQSAIGVYFDERPDVNTILETIRNELFGNRIYPVTEQEYTAQIEEEGQAQQMREDAEMMGIEIKGKTDEQIQSELLAAQETNSLMEELFDEASIQELEAMQTYYSEEKADLEKLLLEGPSVEEEIFASIEPQEEVAAKPAEVVKDDERQKPAAEPKKEAAPSPQVRKKRAKPKQKLEEKTEGETAIEKHRSYMKRVGSGDITAKDLVEGFEAIVANEDAIKAELSKRTLKQLAPRGTGGRKKADIVQSIYDGMRRDYIIGSYSFDPFSEKVVDAQRREVQRQTDKEIQEYSEKIKKRDEDVKKALDDPQTLEDFRYYMGAKKATYGDLPDNLKKRYDDLLGKAVQKTRAKRKEQKAVVKAVDLGETEMSIQKTKHSKKGIDLWVVKLSDRVGKEKFKEMVGRAKQLGGYYSRYAREGAIPGFQFETEESANKFAQLKEGDVSRKDVIEERELAKEENAIKRLNMMADSLETLADESLNRDRLVNTAKRAREAESADASARADKAFAKTLRNIAKAIEAGEVKIIDAIRTKADVRTIDEVLAAAHRKWAQKQSDKSDDYNKNYNYYRSQKPTEDALSFVEYPEMWIRSYGAEELADAMSSVKGYKRDALKLKRMAVKAKKKNDAVDITTLKDFDMVMKLARAAKNTKKDTYNAQEILDRGLRITRLKKMDVPNVRVLRAALREYLNFKSDQPKKDKVKELERGIVGQKVGIDFFPTPKELSNRMVEIADIGKGDKVLEPSAGNGNIADSMRDSGAEVDVAEISPQLREILDAKGYNVVGSDFMNLEEGDYDAVIMNPPFSKNQDIQHVQQAYKLTKDGGKVVAIVGEGAFFRKGKKETAFREWLNEVGAEIEELPANTFQDKTLLQTTGANARLVTIVKEDIPFKPRLRKADTGVSFNNSGDTIDIATEHLINMVSEKGLSFDLTSQSTNRHGGRSNYLTVSGENIRATVRVSDHFANPNFRTDDVWITGIDKNHLEESIDNFVDDFIKEDKETASKNKKRINKSKELIKNVEFVNDYKAYKKAAKRLSQYKSDVRRAKLEDKYSLEDGFLNKGDVAEYINEKLDIKRPQYRKAKDRTEESVEELPYFTGGVYGNYIDYKDLPTETQKIVDVVRSEIKKIAPFVDVMTFESLAETAIGDKPVLGAFTKMGDPINIGGLKHIVALSMAKNGKIKSSAWHEGIHALKNTGLFKDDEWSALEKEARDQNWIKNHNIEKLYKDAPEGMSEAQFKELQLEEAIAEEFASRRGKGFEKDGEPTVIERIFKKIDNLLKRIRAALRRKFKGIETADDVFEKIKSGEIGARPLPESEKTVKAFKKSYVPKMRKRQPELDVVEKPKPKKKPEMFKFEGGSTKSRATWDVPEASSFDDFVQTVQDRFVDLKRIQESIAETGKEIIDTWNPYLQEELYHGRTAKRIYDFVSRELVPLTNYMKETGLELEHLENYLHARHAKEANALIAERNPDIPDGGSGMTNAEADQFMDSLSPEDRKVLEQAAKHVDGIIERTRQTYVDYGLISGQEAKDWADMFKHYIPLMREDDGMMGIGQGFSVRGDEVKSRVGSTRKVVNILGNIALQREKAIVRGEKNRVALALAGLVKMNPNPEFWSLDTMRTKTELNKKTGQVETSIIPEFKSADNVIAVKIKDRKGNVHDRAIVFNRDNDRAMRLSKALKNLDSGSMNKLMELTASITRYFSAINTQYNIIFGVTNLARDVQAAILNTGSTPLKGKAKKIANPKRIKEAIKAIYQSSRAARKGETVDTEWSKWWDDMQAQGGMTGWRDIYRTSEDRADAIRAQIDPQAWAKSPMAKAFRADGKLKTPLSKAKDASGFIFDWLSDYNQTMEGAIRLVTYRAAVESGVSKAKAASIAKNITVNFNRKGRIGREIGALYAFFNAAVQGTARIGETLFTMKGGDVKTLRLSRVGKKIVYGGLLLGAMQATMLKAAFDDDEPPEFVRERNIIIPLGDGKYSTIPMPLGYHAIVNVGRVSTEYLLGGAEETHEHISKLIAVFAEAFNPLGNAGLSLQTITPTLFDPMAAIAQNKDWTGKKIAREDFSSLNPTPGFTRKRDTSSGVGLWLAEALNTMSGGDEYQPGLISPTPDQIDYLIGQVTGGVGREITKTSQTAQALATGEELPPYKIPLVGRFYGTTKGQHSQSAKFYKALEKANIAERAYKDMSEKGEDTTALIKKKPEYQIAKQMRKAQRMISKLRKRKRVLVERNAPRKRVREIENRITDIMTTMNQEVEKLRKKK